MDSNWRSLFSISARLMRRLAVVCCSWEVDMMQASPGTPFQFQTETLRRWVWSRGLALRSSLVLTGVVPKSLFSKISGHSIIPLHVIPAQAGIQRHLPSTKGRHLRSGFCRSAECTVTGQSMLLTPALSGAEAHLWQHPFQRFQDLRYVLPGDIPQMTDAENVPGQFPLPPR